MTDAHTEDTREPKDHAGDRFPDFHHDHLKAVETRVAALKSTLAKLVDTFDTVDTNVNLLLQTGAQDEKRIALLGERVAALEGKVRALEDARNFDGANFVDLRNRVGQLEIANERPSPSVKWVETLEEKIETFEQATRSTSDDYEKRIAGAESTIAKQRAVNEALEKWSDPYAAPSEADECKAKEALNAALREALK